MVSKAKKYDFLDGITPDEQSRLLDAVEMQAMRENPLLSPAAFAVAHSHGGWEPYRHLKFISDEIVRGVEQNAWDLLILTTPPRHGKSVLTSQWLPAWFIAKFHKRVLLCSYEADFAATHGRRTKEILAEVGSKYGVTMNKDSRAAARWDVIEGGGMMTAGVGGPITGKGGDLVIIDDPVKNMEEAQSPVFREKAWEWWTSTFITRREPGAKIVLILTRWHDDDLAGRVIRENYKKMRVKIVNLPAIAEDNDPLGRQPGEPLCRERYDESALAMIRESVGSRVWTSLYQQRPQRAGGSVFQRHTFDYWTKEGDMYLLGDREFLCHEDELMVFATMDPAYTRGRRSDYTALGVWGVTPHSPSRMLLLHGYRVRVDTAEHAPLVEAAWRAYKPVWIGIEKQSASLTLLTEAQRRGVVVRPLLADKSKGARAETAAALYQAGRIYHPKDAGDWLETWEDELLSFPMGKNDDAVDVTAYAAIVQAQRGAFGRSRPSEEDENRILRHLHTFERNKKRHTRHPVIGAI